MLCINKFLCTSYLSFFFYTISVSVILHAFLLSVDFFFFKLTFFFFFFKKIFHTVIVSNSLDPGQTRRFVGPDLGPDCLQKLSADNKRERVNLLIKRC